MNNEQSIELMKSSTSVEDWNKNRVRIALEATNPKMLAYVDGSGLITRVLGSVKLESKGQRVVIEKWYT